MAFKNIFIENGVHLSVKNEQLIITKEGEYSVPLEDINSICIESLKTNITTYCLYKMVEHDIAVFICNEKHLPTGILLGTNSYSRQLKNINKQLSMPKPIIKRIWQDIVKQKIENQATVLKRSNIEGGYKKLIALKEAVMSGDTTNVEARAAAIYFKELFGNDFSRKDEYFYNSALNYGYAIVRGMICRTLVMYGFETSIGIFHHNQLNNFNLADDLIECFRPLVDLYIINKVEEKDILDSESKKKIYNVINSLIEIDGKSYNVQTAIENVVKSLSTSMEKRANCIKLPVLNDLRVYRYA